MNFEPIFFAAYMLAALLFWRKRKITMAIFLHWVVVGVLMAICDTSINFIEFYSEQFNMQEVDFKEIEKLEFLLMYSSVKLFAFPLFIIWFYQWWKLGKERELAFVQRA